MREWLRYGLLLLVPLLMMGAAPVGASGEASGAKQAAARAEVSQGAAKQAKAPSLSQLRRSCYGGRLEAKPDLVLGSWRRSAAAAGARKDHERVAYWVRKALQGGDKEEEFLPVLIVALEEVGQEGQEAALDACRSLHQRVGGAKPPAAP